MQEITGANKPRDSEALGGGANGSAVGSARQCGALPQYRLLAMALDQLQSALFVVTAEMNLAHANRRGHALIEYRDGVELSDGRLSFVERYTADNFARMLRHKRKFNSSTNHFAFRVVRANALPDFQALVTLVSASSHSDPTFCIWLFDAASKQTIDPELLRGLHGLTDTESRVAASLFAGCSLEETAREFGISVNTVKTHLKHIFQKCEVRSQAELLQMLALGPRAM